MVAVADGVQATWQANGHAEPSGVGWPANSLVLAAVTLAAVLVLIEEIAPVPAPVRVPAGLLLSLAGPGFAGLLALRPRWLTPWTHVALSLPLSLSAAVLYAAVLDLTPGGFGGSRMPVGIAVLTLGLAAVSVESGNVVLPGAPAGRRLPQRVRPAAVVPVLLLAGWGSFAFAHAMQRNEAPRYSVLSAGDSLARSGSGTVFAVSVANHEGATRTYRINVIDRRADGARTTRRSLSFTLGNGDESTHRVSARCGRTTEIKLKSPGRHHVRRDLLLRPPCRGGRLR
jgi:hypothetical protein